MVPSAGSSSAVTPQRLRDIRDLRVDPGWDWTPTPSKTIMLKGVQYPSATAALQAYIEDYEGKSRRAKLPKRFIKPGLVDVDTLLMSSMPRGADAAQSKPAESNRAMRQMVHTAYEQLVDARQKKLQRSQLLERATFEDSQQVLDNMSSLGTSSNDEVLVVQSGSSSTDTLLQKIAAHQVTQSRRSASDQLLQKIATHQHQPGGMTGTQLPKHGRETESYRRPTLSQSRKVHQKSRKEDADAIPQKLTPRIKSTLAKLRQLRIKNQSIHVQQNRSQDDLDLLKAKTSPLHSSAPVRGPPSWVQELEGTEITSVLDQGAQDTSAGRTSALHISDLASRAAISPTGKHYALDDSVVLDGRAQTSLLFTPQKQTDTRTQINDLSAGLVKINPSIDRLSMTTDELLLTSPDGKYLYSSHKGKVQQGVEGFVSSEPWRPVLQSRPDYSASVYSPASYPSPDRHIPPSPLAAKYEMNVSAPSQDESFIANAPVGSMLSNPHHRAYIQQLMRDIEDSASSVALATPAEELLQTIPKKSVSFLDDRGATAGATDVGDGFLERVRNLLAAAPSMLDDDLRRTPSPGTDIILDGDRPWEKPLASFKPPVYSSSLNTSDVLTAGRKNTLVGQFLEECLASTTEEPPTLTGRAQPGSMEALKNMLFTVQTMVPSEVDISSSDNVENLQALNPSGQGVSSGASKEALALEHQGKSCVPADLQHLLSNSFEHQQNSQSLDQAMQHLSVLKSLVGTK